MPRNIPAKTLSSLFDKRTPESLPSKKGRLCFSGGLFSCPYRNRRFRNRKRRLVISFFSRQSSAPSASNLIRRGAAKEAGQGRSAYMVPLPSPFISSIFSSLSFLFHPHQIPLQTLLRILHIRHRRRFLLQCAYKYHFPLRRIYVPD